MEAKGESHQVVWTSSKPPGVEHCVVTRRPNGWAVEGSVVRRFELGVGAVSYRIDLDGGWGTRRAVVEQVLKGKRSVLELESESSGWHSGGRRLEGLGGCVDVDLEVSPATNTLPIRRVPLALGKRVELTATWVRFPSLKVQPLAQSYERVGKRRYRYRSASGFTSEIEVDSFGLVKRYGDYWYAV